MSATVSRDEQHPFWCADHANLLGGPLGECNSDSYEGLRDEQGAALQADVHQFDGDKKPWALITLLTDPAGEDYSELPLDTAEVLLRLLDNHPEEVAPMLRHLVNTTRTEVPA